MKIKNYIFAVTLFASFFVMANDNMRIMANRCLSMASDSKIPETQFRTGLKKLEDLCKTTKERQYFEEIKLLAEAKFNKRPLVTAVTNFTCEDTALAMMVKPSAIAEMLEASLDESYTKVSRKDIDKAIEELKFQNSDLFDPKTSAKLGSFVGAQYIICGNIQKIKDRIVITARVIEVKSGIIIKDGLLKDLRDAGEIPDAIPSLAKKLSIKNKQETEVSLSNYAIKYLNLANKKILSENLEAASADIVHGNMFLSDFRSQNSLIKLQTALTASTCYMSQRNYKSAMTELNNSLDMAKKIFGDTDDVTIHYYYNLAKNYLQHGDIEKAATAFLDAKKRFERTKEARQGGSVPFASFEQVIRRQLNKESFSFNKAKLDLENNSFIQEKFKLKGPASKAVQKSIPVQKGKQQAEIKPIRSSKPAEYSGELKALLRTLEHQNKQKLWSQIPRTAAKIFAKDPGNSRAKEVLKNRIKQIIKTADAQIAEGNYTDATAALSEIKDALSPDNLRKTAMCYEKSGNLQEALNYYTAAGNQKDVMALMWLAENAIKKNDLEAGIKHYEAAAALGHAKAYQQLSGVFLSKRNGVYNEEKGISYMRKAAEAGVPAAQYNLGCCYANFRGTKFASVPYNRDMAIKWLLKAKENGIKQADQRLTRLKYSSR